MLQIIAYYKGVNAIMAIRGDNNFLDALLTMNLYLQDEDKGTRRIWRGRK